MTIENLPTSFMDGPLACYADHCHPFANSLEHCNFWYFRIGIVELKGNSVRLGHAHPQLSEKWVR